MAAPSYNRNTPRAKASFSVAAPRAGTAAPTQTAAPGPTPQTPSGWLQLQKGAPSALMRMQQQGQRNIESDAQRRQDENGGGGFDNSYSDMGVAPYSSQRTTVNGVQRSTGQQEIRGAGSSEVSARLVAALSSNPQMPTSAVNDLVEASFMMHDAVNRGVRTPQEASAFFDSIARQIQATAGTHQPDMRPSRIPQAASSTTAGAPGGFGAGLPNSAVPQPSNIATWAPVAPGSQRITPPSVGSAGLAATQSYTIQPGDTLSAIAARVGVSAAALAQANGIANPNLIQAGATLIIPATNPTTGPGSAQFPDGRTVDQIRGTNYASAEERDWYLAQLQMGVPSTGSGAPVAPTATTSRAPASGTGVWSDWGENNTYQGRPFGALGLHPYTGQTTFPPAVEQWRGLVSQFFKPEDVNKALHVIQYESSGNPAATNGYAYGLMQIENLPGRPSPQQMQNPAENLAYAAKLVYRR